MDLTVEQHCPSCGAPITLHEADRLLICPYCDVGNYRIASGLSRFVLPDKAPEDVPREKLLYIPYLRFKGNIFSCQGKDVEHRVVDTTHQGISASPVPLSLGLRPQAMSIYPATHTLTGRFFRQTEKPAAVLAMAAELSDFRGKEKSELLYHRVFIGETISCIYLPVYQRDGALFDGVLNRPLGQAAVLEQSIAKTLPFRDAWSPRFLATICPQCAGVLKGERDSLVLACSNCQSQWAEYRGKFARLSWRVVTPVRDVDEPLYLPFWRIRPRISGVTLSSFGDFLRLTNQPVAITGEHDGQDFSFWIPAVKIRPKFFLQLAKSLTLSQHRIGTGASKMVHNLYPVTLRAADAFQALKTVLADITLDKRHLLPRLPSIVMQSPQVELVYLPFAHQGHDLVQEETRVCVASTILEFGRSL